MDGGSVDARLRISLAWSFSRATTHLNAPVCPYLQKLGFIHRTRSDRLWYPFNATYEGHPDLQKTGNLRAVQLLLGHTKMDSIVRYLGVELNDALAVAEAIGI